MTRALRSVTLRALMNRFVLSLFALALLACSPPAGSPTETDPSSCSNGRDDDGDGMTDCRDLACSVFEFCASADAGVDASVTDADIDAARTDAGVCSDPLDVVFVIDVSTSMTGELTAVRDGLVSIWNTADELSSNAQFSLVVFVDDVLAVNDCAPFETPEELASELDTWIAFCATNQSPVSHIQNRDCPENSLDAMQLAATTCPFRPASTRILVHVTDDTFVERPGVLSGEWGGGVFVEHTYAEVEEELVADEIRVGAFAIPGPGESCGPGIPASSDVGRGFHTPFGDMESLPTATGGRVWDLREVRADSLDMAQAINEMLRAEYCVDF